MNPIPFVIAFVLPPLVVMSIQALLIRFFKNRSAQALTMIAMVLGYFLYFLLLTQIEFEIEKNLAFYCYMFLLYSFSAYTYFHAFNMSETSRRVRLIQTIANHPACQLADLESAFDDQRMIQTRLDRMVSLGQVKEEKGVYYPTGVLFRNAALIIYFCGWILDRPWGPMRAYRLAKSKR